MTLTFDERVSRAIPLCARLAYNGDFAEAFALAWMVIVNADAQDYSTASRNALVMPDRNESAALLADRHYDSVDDLALELRNLHAQNDACQILLVLDRMLFMRTVAAAAPLASGAYSSGVTSITLSPEAILLTGLPDVCANCSVLRRTYDSKLSRFETQHHHPFRHTPHYTVVRNSPDPASPSLHARVAQASTSLDSAFAALANDGMVRIYLAEFKNPPAFVPVNPRDKMRWTASGLGNEAQIKVEMIAHLTTAVAERADVIVFPELMISPTLKAEMAKWLRIHNPFIEELGRSQITLTVAGSFHVPADGGTVHCNETWALDAQGNEIVALKHQKICPVVLNMDDKQLVESIREGRTLSLLNTSGGVHCLVICLDLAQGAETSLPLNRLPINWLWVPSLSGKVTPHRGRAHQMNLSTYSVVACANQGPAAFYPDMPVANQKSSQLSFIISTRADEPDYEVGDNYKIGAVDMRQ